VGGLTSPSAADTNEVQVGIFSASAGINSWNSTTVYPFPVGGESCVTYALSVTCVGGYQENNPIESISVSSSVYSAPILVSGLGSWTEETPYPRSVTLESCVTSGGYLDCIGGFNGSRENSGVYFSLLTKSGDVGTWTASTSYPISVNSPSCVAVSGYVYCVGGAAGSTGYSAVYFAPLLSSGGVGTWASTTAYPTTVYSHSCSANENYIYCVGGYANKQYSNEVYYAPLSATGVGTWTQAANYPFAVGLLDCAVYTSALYCFGGYNQQEMSNQVYYSPIPPFQLATTTSTTTSTVTMPTTTTVTTTASNTVTVTSSVTSTETFVSLFTLTRTSTVTSTTQSISTSTTTRTTTLVSSSTVTVTTQTQTPPSAVAYLTELGPAIVGVVAGVALAMLISRLRRGGKPSASPGG